MENIGTISFDDGWHDTARGASGSASRIRAPWHDGAVHSLAPSLDGSLVCSAGADGAVRVWDLARAELRWQFERAARQVLVSPDARLAYAITEGFEIWPLDLITGQELERAWAPPRRVLRGARPDRTALSPDGRWALPSCADDRGDVHVVDLTAGTSFALVAPGAGEVHPVGTFTHDARSVWALGGVRDGRSGRARSAVYRFALADGVCEEIHALRLLRQGAPVALPLHRERCVFGGRWLVVSDGRVLLRWELTHNAPAVWLRADLDAMARAVTGDRVFACSFARDRAVAMGSHATEGVHTALTLPPGEQASTLMLAPDERALFVGMASGRVARVTRGLSGAL